MGFGVLLFRHDIRAMTLNYVNNLQMDKIIFTILFTSFFNVYSMAFCPEFVCWNPIWRNSFSVLNKWNNRISTTMISFRRWTCNIWYIYGFIFSRNKNFPIVTAQNTNRNIATISKDNGCICFVVNI